MSPCPHVPVSPCPRVPMSPCPRVPMSPCPLSLHPAKLGSRTRTSSLSLSVPWTIIKEPLRPTTRHFHDVVGFYGIMGKHLKWAFLDLRSFCFNELLARGPFLFHFLPYLFDPISAFPLSLDFYLARANKLTENPACYLLIRKKILWDDAAKRLRSSSSSCPYFLLKRYCKDYPSPMEKSLITILPATNQLSVFIESMHFHTKLPI